MKAIAVGARRHMRDDIVDTMSWYVDYERMRWLTESMRERH